MKQIKKKCFVLTSQKEYVRTQNFMEFTSNFFEHTHYIDIMNDKKSEKKIRTKIFFRLTKLLLINSLIQVINVYYLIKKGLISEYIYVEFNPLVTILCKIYNIKIISDILEPFPEIFSNNYIRHKYWKYKEKIVVKNSHIILTVTKEEEKNLSVRYNINNIFTIHNFPNIKIFKPSSNKFSKFSIVYFGVSSNSRNLNSVTKAIKKLQNKYEIEFHLIGDKNLIQQINCKFIYHGWLESKYAANIINKCHIGIAPYNFSSHTNLTLQNKSFQYAACDVIPLSTELFPLKKYEFIQLVPQNNVENWYNHLNKLFKLWTKNKLDFDLRNDLIHQGWTAEQEWQKMKSILSEES